MPRLTCKLTHRTLSSSPSSLKPLLRDSPAPLSHISRNGMSSPVNRHKRQSTRTLPEARGGRPLWQLPPRSQPIVGQPAPSQLIVHPHIARRVDHVVFVALEHKHSDVAQVRSAARVENARNLASRGLEGVFEVDVGGVDGEVDVFEYKGGRQL